MVGDERGLLGRGQLGQQPGERVDDAVERVERYQLALVAAASENDRAVSLGDLGGEDLRERALADSRWAAQEHLADVSALTTSARAAGSKTSIGQ